MQVLKIVAIAFAEQQHRPGMPFVEEKNKKILRSQIASYICSQMTS